jgi:hypothetical protein
VLNADGTEAQWPEAEFIIGNPPFLGNKRMISVLGEDYTETLRGTYEGRVPGGADLVTYWFEKARATLQQGKVKHVGLVSPQAIRAGSTRTVLERIKESGEIFEAWSDEPWIVEGAAVRVSLVRFSPKPHVMPHLDGKPVVEIFSDLTARDIQMGADLTRVNQLPENFGKAFQGPVKVGPFDIPGNLARSIFQMPLNPNSRRNSDVVKPWANGMDVTRRPSDTWIIDFGEMAETEACLYEAPVSVPEVVESYPDRILAKNEAAAQVLKQRTLTNLYNERPAWLDNAHHDLDAAVADADGWKPDVSDDEMLTKLLALNLERVNAYPKRVAQFSR